MKRIDAQFPLPGGCFAEGYHWRGDGIGMSHNYWQSQVPPGLDHTETNEFGIQRVHPFVPPVGRLAVSRANLGSGSPQKLHEWCSTA